MRLSNRQKGALEKITGRPWNKWGQRATEAYFAFTDRGNHTALFDKVWRLQHPGNKFDETEQELWDLMQFHTFHPVTIEMWKEDFAKGLLFLSDFDGSPSAYKKHAKEVYDGVMYNGRKGGVL